MHHMHVNVALAESWLHSKRKTDLQHLLPVEADEVFVQLVGPAAFPPGLLMLGQQASQVNVPILQHHVDGAL